MAPTLRLVASPFAALPSLTPFQSAVMAGFKVVAVKSLPDGSLDLVDLREKAEKYKENLAACMV
jgi:glycine cleavage system protein P-like pyridoxal-binding family